jgi:hypothetical protein
MNNLQNPTLFLKDHRITAGLTLLALIAFSGITNAASLAIQNTTGTWSSYDYDNTTAQYAPDYVQGVNTNSLYWGYPYVTGQPESLIFQGNATPGAIYTPFAVGALTHANNAIWGSTNITSANLKLHLSLADAPSLDFTYKFDIFQSGYNADPHLSYRDTLTFSPVGSTQFSLGGQTYAFTLNGFLDNGQIWSNIVIEDGQTVTQAPLYATISTVTPVPAPAALWLLGSGLIGLAGFAKRKRIPQ